MSPPRASRLRPSSVSASVLVGESPRPQAVQMAPGRARRGRKEISSRQFAVNRSHGVTAFPFAGTPVRLPGGFCVCGSRSFVKDRPSVYRCVGHRQLIAPKSFTSVAILRLETAEKLTIEDKLGVSDKTGEPISGSSAEHPSAFGLGVGAGFRPAPGAYWRCQGMTLGYRVLYAYFPKSGAVIVAGLNSQPDDRRNQMALNVHRGGASAMRAGRLIRDAARLVCWRTSFPLSMLSNVQHVPAIMRIRSVPCLSSSCAFSV